VGKKRGEKKRRREDGERRVGMGKLYTEDFHMGKELYTKSTYIDNI
jgi:regulator of replication initiation timing